MWAWRPRTSRPAASQRSTAAGSVASGIPNFESSWPVAIFSWVSGRIPGVTRRRTRWRRPAASRSSRSISSKRVDDHVADAGVERLQQLGLGLVVAVHVDPLRRRTRRGAPGAARRRRRRRRRAPPRRTACRRRCRLKRLARVEDLEALGPLGEGGDRLAGAGAEVVLGIDVGGGAELGRELDQVAAADLDPTALVDAAPGREDRRARDRVRERAARVRDRSQGPSSTGIVTGGAP